MDLLFLMAVALVATASGATAAVVGFGIGSLLTPLLATRYEMGIAVAAVAIPHAVATALRCWRLREAIDRRVIRTFGVVSALGGIAGAAAYTRFGSRTLTIALAVLLLLTASATLTGWSARWHPRGPVVWILGLLSGGFGGLAGNQGGLRAAALSPFGLTPAAFVATSTAIGLMVDAARLPVYSARLLNAEALPTGIVAATGVATLGVVAGTLFGGRVLGGMSVERFRIVLGVAIGALGAWLLLAGR